MKNALNLVWIDLEMTGLDPDRERIIEIATIVTDKDLNILAEGPVFAISQPQGLLDNMDAWNTKTHNKTGLVERVQKSKISEADAQAGTIDFLSSYVKAGQSPICGNSVWQDRRFLYRYMPELDKFFHYRMVDVSTFKELSRRWYPDVAKGFKKDTKHEALSDIRESIEEMVYYRDKLLPSGR